MGIARKGGNTSKSLSPDIIQSAWHSNANSRNLSALGSRQTLMRLLISENIRSSSNSSITCNLSFYEIYLSNFSLEKVDLNSAYVSILAAKLFNLTALLYAAFGMKFLNWNALISVFVSKTNDLIILIQDFLKNFLSKTIGLGLFAYPLQQFIETGQFALPNYVINLIFKRFLKMCTQLWRYFLQFLCGFTTDFYNYLFHSPTNLLALNDTKSTSKPSLWFPVSFHVFIEEFMRIK